MGFKWSKNAEHIQSLFRAWSVDDGWDEIELMDAEKLLGLRFPTILRNFQLSWGKRKDFTSSREQFLAPKECFVHLGHLIFCVENQAILFWGIPLDVLDQEDPPVYYVLNEDNETEWKLSHIHLTHFLDALMYAHAFAQGAVHGGFVRDTKGKEIEFRKLLRRHFQEITLESNPWGIFPSPNIIQWWLFVDAGIAIDACTTDLWIATQTEKALSDLGDLLDLRWDETW